MILVRTLAPRGTSRELPPSSITTEASETMVKGEYVSFVMKGGTRTVDPPTNYVMIQDVDGGYYRECDFYIVQYRFLQTKISYFSEGLQATARRYYGNRARFEEGVVALPTANWQSFGRVDAIRYRRKGERANDYEHLFGNPAFLQRSVSPLAYRIRLPDHCVADERGFRWP